MIVEIAVETGTAPRDWWDEDDETLATVLDVLEDRAEKTRKAVK